jgi:hypothetical protein
MAGTSPDMTKANRTPPFHRVHFESAAEKSRAKIGPARLKAGRRRDTVLANFQLALAWEASR